jgi:hypothetical protein
MVLQLTAGWSGDDSQSWLSMLVGAMEDAARPECRAVPCAPSTLAELRAQLARPVPLYPHAATVFNRCN